MNNLFSLRKPLALSAVLTLLFALWGGLVRLQWPFPIPQADWISFHGPLMVSGFFGTVISMARANILRSKLNLPAPLTMWVPLAAALGAWTFLVGGPERWGEVLFLAASLGYLAVCVGYFRLQPALFAGLALMGGMAWAFGNTLWFLGRPIPRVAAGWQVFFVLTILAERLEIVHWRESGPALIPPFLLALLMLGGSFLTAQDPALGVRIVSAGFLTAGLFHLAIDAWPHVEKAEGWRWFSRLCLFSGYGWMVAGGWIGLTAAPVDSGLPYDAYLHAIFLGMVFTMVFNHAPLLLPRVLKSPVPFHPFFYFHWALLQGSLILRLAGDGLADPDWRRWGALLNAVAVLLFFANTVWAILRGRKVKS